jgi:tRNA dimethylallyltransferase
MDVATGKPTAVERAAVPHHLLDLIEPDQRYHAARFRKDAIECIEAIRSRGRLPVVVGGTGLYIRALLRGLDPAPPADPDLRARLEAEAALRGVPELHARLAALDPEAARRLHPNDRVRIIRAIEKHGRGGGGGGEEGSWARAVPPWRVLLIGLGQERGTLNQRLEERAHGMLSGGIMNEVRRLLEAGYDEASPGMAGIGYRQFAAVARGRLRETEALALMVRDTRRYAKRQMTWFVRETGIRWLDVDETGGPEGAAERIAKEITREAWTG